MANAKGYDGEGLPPVRPEQTPFAHCSGQAAQGGGDGEGLTLPHLAVDFGSASVVRSMQTDQSPAAERLHDVNFVGRIQWRVESGYLFTVHKDAHVTANRILLIDHAKADAGELAVEIGKHFGHRGAGSGDGITLLRI